jgi:hypothetical protein
VIEAERFNPGGQLLMVVSARTLFSAKSNGPNIGNQRKVEVPCSQKRKPFAISFSEPNGKRDVGGPRFDNLTSA